VRDWASAGGGAHLARDVIRLAAHFRCPSCSAELSVHPLCWLWSAMAGLVVAGVVAALLGPTALSFALLCLAAWLPATLAVAAASKHLVAPQPIVHKAGGRAHSRGRDAPRWRTKILRAASVGPPPTACSTDRALARAWPPLSSLCFLGEEVEMSGEHIQNTFSTRTAIRWVRQGAAVSRNRARRRTGLGLLKAHG
jgi:hypothetical protein